MMKKILLALLLCAAPSLLAQGIAVSIRSGTTDPATCQPRSLNIFVNRSAVPSVVKVCSNTNTWTQLATGSGAAPVNTTATASNFFTAYNSTTGVFTKAQPAFSDISGSAVLAQFPTIATNTVLGNSTAGTAVPTALAVGTCSGATNALNWTTNTGFGCNGSITANTATTATTATNVGITDDTTTNATMFPLWVTAASGNLPPKVSSTKLTLNPSTGAFSLAGLVITSRSAAAAGNDMVAVNTAVNGWASVNPRTDNIDFPVRAYGSTFSLFTRGGMANLTGWASVFADTNAATGPQGLLIGLDTDKPIVFSTVTSERVRFNSSTATFTTSITPAQVAGIVGATTNNNAAAGAFGEYQTAATAANTTALTTATSANVGAGTNFSLTAGDWDCSGVVNFTFGATTSVTNLSGGLSTVTGTLGAQDTFFDLEYAAMVPTNGKVMAIVVPMQRFSLAGTTNIFLVTQATFTLSTATAGGTYRCRRVR